MLRSPRSTLLACYEPRYVTWPVRQLLDSLVAHLASDPQALLSLNRNRRGPARKILRRDPVRDHASMRLALRAAHLAAVATSSSPSLEAKPVAFMVRAKEARPFRGVSERLHDIDPKLFRGVAHEQPSAQCRQVNRARSIREAPFDDVRRVKCEDRSRGAAASRDLSDKLNRRRLSRDGAGRERTRQRTRLLLLVQGQARLLEDRDAVRGVR